jgi:tetratricopeptide (TPR) repeat protein
MLLARHYEQQVRERQDVDEDTLLEAIRLYREATEADPESALAHSRLAGALMYFGDLEAAEAPINRALTINPNLSEVQNTLGEFRWAQGLVRESRLAWARAVELNPNNPEALQNYARARWWAIEEAGVPELYRRAVALDPLNLEQHAALGAYLALEGHTEEAREVVATVEQLFDGAASFTVLATLLDYLGDVDQSIAWTIRARNLEPDNPAHVQKLAEFYADIGDGETALTLDPNGVGVLYKLRRFEDMIETAEFAMIDQPQDMMLRALLASSYNAVDQYESAIRTLRGTGLPESQFNGWRTAEEEYAFVALKNALFGIGESEMARKLAHLTIHDIGYTDSDDWFLSVYKACDYAILGEDEEARKALSQAQGSLHLVWEPILKDSLCFEQLMDDPVYQATVRHFNEHRNTLRERLPATLEAFGVSL